MVKKILKKSSKSDNVSKTVKSNIKKNPKMQTKTTITKSKTKAAKEGLIHKDMTMGEVLAKYPDCAAVMKKYGLSCVGCSVSYSETLEEGVLSHGYDKTTVESMLKEMNKVAKEKKTQPENLKEINITESAAKKILEIAKKEKMEGYGLRFSVIPGGCSGFSYSMNFDKEPMKDDLVFKDNNVKVFIDSETLQFVKGVTIDYIESLEGSGFKITNPNARSSCGCGKSFN